MTSSENLDPTILPTGLVSYFNHYISLKKKKKIVSIEFLLLAIE